MRLYLQILLVLSPTQPAKRMYYIRAVIPHTPANKSIRLAYSVMAKKSRHPV